MSTETAQRRLLEALSNMHEGPGGVNLSALSYGLRVEAASVIEEYPAVSDFHLAVADLADAIRADLASRSATG